MNDFILVEDKFQNFLWFCKERYNIKLRKEAGLPRPWTEDEILDKRHFCNVFRSDDKTSKVIFSLIKAQSTPQLKIEAAILGRRINSHVTIPLAWDRRHDSNLPELLAEYGINSNAYKLHTPRGLNNFAGIAEICSTERRMLSIQLVSCKSLQAAHNYLAMIKFLVGFTGYQIILDLLQTNFWDDQFDAEWVFCGPGASRGADCLTGEDKGEYHWRKNATGRLSEAEQNHLRRYCIFLYKKVMEEWPTEWPDFTIHEAEFMLCEFDKYNRKKNGAPGGRIYRQL